MIAIAILGVFASLSTHLGEYEFCAMGPGLYLIVPSEKNSNQGLTLGMTIKSAVVYILKNESTDTIFASSVEFFSYISYHINYLINDFKNCKLRKNMGTPAV